MSVFVYHDQVLVESIDSKGVNQIFIPLDRLDETYYYNGTYHSYWIHNLVQVDWMTNELITQLSYVIKERHQNPFIDWADTMNYSSLYFYEKSQGFNYGANFESYYERIDFE